MCTAAGGTVKAIVRASLHTPTSDSRWTMVFTRSGKSRTQVSKEYDTYHTCTTHK